MKSLTQSVNLRLAATLTLTIALLGTVLLGSSAYAVERAGIGGRPANPDPDNPRTESIFIHEVEQAESIEDAVRVINNTAETKEVLVYAVDAVSSTGGAFACAQLAQESEGVGSWLELEQTEVTLAPQSSTDIPFVLTVPENASPGEHNGCIVIQEKTEPAEVGGTGIRLSFRTGLRVAVLVPGEIIRELNVAGPNVRRSDNNLVIIQPQVANEGNVSIDTQVTVWLKSILGKTLAKKTSQYPVLPSDEVASWNFEFDKPYWGGLYRAQFAIAYDENPDARVGLDTESEPITKKSRSVIFYSFPTLTAGLIQLAILIGAGLLAGYWLLDRKRQAWIQTEWVEYTTKSADDINSLAKKFDISWKILAKANKLQAPYVIKPKQKLLVPPKRG